MTTPTTARGAPTDATPSSMAGDAVFARPTTATRQTRSRPRLNSAVRDDGGVAWSSAAAPCGGRK
jgi:hypothetical protein